MKKIFRNFAIFPNNFLMMNREKLISQRLTENQDLADGILKRFTKYVTFETQSNDIEIENRKPSTPGQLVLGENMKKELMDLGISNVTMDEHGFVIAKIPATPGYESKKSVCFIAHMDTALEVSGKDVKPQVHANYDLSPIHIKDVVIDTENTPILKICKGDTLIHADGTTLLGADDKAGISIIMTAMDSILNISEIPHGPLEVMFNADEEVGFGTKFFTPDMLNSRIAYTIDGETEGKVECETFNGSLGTINFHGVSIHPGEGRGRFVNANSMAASFVSMLPRSEAPESTDGRYGYYSCLKLEGSSEHATAVLLIRDFDKSGLEERQRRLQLLAAAVEAQFPGGKVEVSFRFQYPNMYNYLKDNKFVMDNVIEAAKKIGIEVVSPPIRGGTDGSELSRMGILTPNIWTGSINHHSRREVAILSQMISSCQLIIEIVKLYAQE